MKTLLVADKADNWLKQIPGIELVRGKDYLSLKTYSELRSTRVYNLCHSYRYQSIGYYVSLLAAARGHKPVPSITAVQDMKSQTVIRAASSDLEGIIQRSLASIKDDKFTLSVYFGRNMAKRHDRLSRELFLLFQAPLLRAYFTRSRDKWLLQNVDPIPAGEVSESHREFVILSAVEFFGRPKRNQAKKNSRYDLAILYSEADPTSPSDPYAIKKFIKAGERQGLYVETISKNDFTRLLEFDALFIRETTDVLHHTYRFSRKAALEGLIVVDDPESIARCTNKVFLSELFSRHHIAAPPTRVVHKSNLNEVCSEIDFPCVLKQPDSSSSLGVVRVENKAEFEAECRRFLSHSELIVAQGYLPTTYDWRIGILGSEAIFACKYHMAEGHWQITNWKSSKKKRYGKVETLAIADVPEEAKKIALKAAALIGDGLYGVDVKQVGGKFLVIEVNDNPNIEAGEEDSILKNELYDKVITYFIKRIEAGKELKRNK